MLTMEDGTPHSNFINHHTNNLSIFPPINHEDLPIPPPPPPPPVRAPHAPLSIDSDDHPSSPSPPPPPNKHNHNDNKNYTQVIKWVDFALHFWNSKLLSFLTHLPSSGFFSSFCSVAATTSFLGFVWYWVCRWRRRKRVSGGGGEESVEHLKALIKAKDEKILQLLEQIAHMNKVLLARYKIPVSKAS